MKIITLWNIKLLWEFYDELYVDLEHGIRWYTTEISLLVIPRVIPRNMRKKWNRKPPHVLQTMLLYRTTTTRSEIKGANIHNQYLARSDINLCSYGLYWFKHQLKALPGQRSNTLSSLLIKKISHRCRWLICHVKLAYVLAAEYCLHENLITICREVIEHHPRDGFGPFVVRRILFCWQSETLYDLISKMSLNYTLKRDYLEKWMSLIDRNAHDTDEVGVDLENPYCQLGTPFSEI